MPEPDVTDVLEDAESAVNADAPVQQEKQSDRRKDLRRESVVALVFLLVSVADAWLFLRLDTWSGPVVIGVLQLLAAIVFAKVMGVEEISLWLTRVLEHTPGSNHNNHDSRSSGL